MLRACALKDSKSWEKCLPYAEFSYNNSYQKSLKMSPFQVLYGHKCQTPLFWNELGENQVFGLEILWEVERQVQIIRELEASTVEVEKLCISENKKIELPSQRFCVFKSVTHERTLPIQDTRKACTKLYWTIQDSRAKK
jgi:hypothetical protein